MQIRFKKLHPDAKTPTYGHPGDAGLDLYASETVTIAPGERVRVPTGIAFEIPEGYVALVWDKSGVSTRDGLTVLGGVFDAGYRGEFLITMLNISDTAFTFEKGHKVAQVLIQPIVSADLVEAEDLSDTSRGEGSVGSTGRV